MKKQDGIALIATLLIMAAIMALGVGTLFLSTMNLKIAENSRTHAVARYNAEAGLEAAAVQLKKDFQTSNQFPTTLKLPSTPNSDVIYLPVGSGSTYTTYTTAGLRTQAQVVIIGEGPNNARYQTEALFGASVTSGTSSNFPKGLASENILSLNGGPVFRDSPLHGNGGYEFSGSTTFCAGTESPCKALTGTDRNVSAGKDQLLYACKAQSGDGLCDGFLGRPTTLVDKLDLGAVPYTKTRNGDTTNPSKFGVKSTDTAATTSIAGCTYVTSLATSYPSGSKICIKGGASVPSGANYAGVTIVVQGDVMIPSTATFTDTNFLSMGALTLDGSMTLASSRVFADGDVTINGPIEYTGNTTIAAGKDFKVGSKGGDIYNAASNEVTLALLAVGKFDAQGSLKGKSDGDFVNAAIFAGGTASINGGAKLRGGIASKGQLTIKGSSEIYGDASFVNTDLSELAMTATPVSRR